MVKLTNIAHDLDSLVTDLVKVVGDIKYLPADQVIRIDAIVDGLDLLRYSIVELNTEVLKTFGLQYDNLLSVENIEEQEGENENENLG
jgi:hypothetical protein